MPRHLLPGVVPRSFPPLHSPSYVVKSCEEGEEGGAYLDDMDLEPYQDDRNDDGLATAGVAHSRPEM